MAKRRQLSKASPWLQGVTMLKGVAVTKTSGSSIYRLIRLGGFGGVMGGGEHSSWLATRKSGLEARESSPGAKSAQVWVIVVPGELSGRR
jgi:hypothetical protein